MGAGLVKAARDVAARLNLDHAPARLFVLMAVVPRDDDPRPTYWNGRTAMAHALGKTGTAGERAADRAVHSLVVAGALRQSRRPAPGGRSARYELLNGQGEPLAVTETRTAERDVSNSDTHRSAVRERAPLSDQRAPLSSQTRTAQRPPEEEEEKKEETRASAPTRTCQRHSTWSHREPCRACGEDKRAAAEYEARRRPGTMSERVIDCGPGKHKVLPDGTCMLCEHRDPLWDVA